jgi:predicted RNA-binding protein with PUA-like domain
MAKWLLKTEPDDYSFQDLVKEKRTVWNGVTNNWAQKFIKEISADDELLIYHSGRERSMAGIAQVVSDIYPDSAKKDKNLFVFDVKPVRALSGQITLKKLKADSFFTDFLLVKFSRLSVMPVEEKYWTKIMAMEKEYRGSA